MRAEFPLMEPAPCLLLLLLWGYCLAVIDGEGELRCYCNESGCVSTGYMCKSPVGQCYTAVEVQGEHTRATHGCLDSIPVHQRGICGQQAIGGKPAEDHRGVEDGGGKRGYGGRARESSKAVSGGRSDGGRSGGEDRTMSRFPLLICCAEDMCNYIENIDFSNIATLTRANGSLHRGGASDRGIIYGEKRNADERDLWFKAAVIAVPIAGGFILVLLVLLAVRMLRTDTQQHRRLIQVRRERSLTKAQLYVTDHFSDVSTTSRGDATTVGGAGKGCSSHFPPKPSSLRTENCPDFRAAGRPAFGGGGGGGSGSERGGGGGMNLIGDRDKGVQNMGIPTASSRGGPGKPLCRDVNISVDREDRVYEKVQCDVSVHRHGHHHHNIVPSVVTWGRPSDLAAVV